MIDSALYFQNSDPHTGAHALELRNGYSSISKFGGSVTLMEEDTSAYSGFINGMTFKDHPKYFSFYYKFFPASSDDTARATFSIINGADGDVKATAEILLSQPTPNYTQTIVPITYTGTGDPTTAYISFAT